MPMLFAQRQRISRRQFIASASLAVTSALNTFQARSAENQPTKPLVGSGLYGWSQYYQRAGKDLNQHLDEVCSAVRDCGFEFLEGFLDVAKAENNLRFSEQMRAKGLKPVCIYTGATLHDKNSAAAEIEKLVAAAKVCRSAGFSIIDVNPNPVNRDKTDEELKTQVASLNTLGKEFAHTGIKLGVHNHMPEMAKGGREFHFDLRQTDPQQVGFCYDVHWVFRGGLQPLACLREYGARIVSWHIRQSQQGVWCEDLDSGDIDYNAVAEFARTHHLQAPYSVELAIENGTRITRSAVENHRRSREFMKRVFDC